MSEVIHIEICKSYKSNKFNIKIGDISGSTESSNATKMEVLEDISDEIDSVFPEPSLCESNNSQGKKDGTALGRHLELRSKTGEDTNKDKPVDTDTHLDTLKSKESQIKQELDKDYAKTKQSESEGKD